MPYNTLGRKRFFTTIAVLAITLINLALSGSVNVFQDFFYVADKFPLALSIITLVMYGMIFFADFTGKNSFIVRAPFLISFELLLCVFWTAGNAFSTSRWSGIPLQCNEIPKDQSDERDWCKSLQALKSFIWIEWLILVLTFLYTLVYIYQQHSKGNRELWNSPLARGGQDSARHLSEFLQYPPTGSAKYTTGPTPIPDEFSRGHTSSGSRGQADMTAFQTDSLRRGQQTNLYASQPNELYTTQPDPYQGAYGSQAGAYTYGTPELPPQQNWAYQQEQQQPQYAYQEEGARDSVAGGPGLAGVGARPAPGAYGGFERM